MPKSLFCKILPLSNCDSRFYAGSTSQYYRKSFRNNILARIRKKNLKLDAEGNAKITEALKSTDKKDHSRVDVSGDAARYAKGDVDQAAVG